MLLFQLLYAFGRASSSRFSLNDNFFGPAGERNDDFMGLWPFRPVEERSAPPDVANHRILLYIP